MTVNQIRDEQSRSAHPRSGVRRLIVLLAVLVLANIPGMVGAQTRAAGNDVDLIERTVLELTQLAGSGNGNELYDWLAVVSRDQVPRESFAAWVDKDAGFEPTGDPVLGDITFSEWVWPVTGATFPNVATVTVEQRGSRLGITSTETTTYHLLNDGNRWRWLFGASKAEVTAVAQGPMTSLSYASEYSSAPYQTIDTFWASIFDDVGLEYLPVYDVVAIDYTPYQTGCGTESNIESAGIYLCLLDRTIYYSPALKTYILDSFGDIGWHTIIAHEWSHQIQSQLHIIYSSDPELDSGAYILELETQADCMTGIYMQDQLGEQAVSRQEVQATRQILSTYGDIEASGWDNPVAHGTGDQRVHSFNTGFRDGFVGCGLDLDTWLP